MPPLNLTITDTSVALEGELDMATVPLLAEAMEALVGMSSQPLTLDLAGLTFVDAAGLRALAAARDLFALEHRPLVLVNPSEMLRRIAEITQLSGRLGLE
jgi:anti-sigma B factor antagonist